VLLSTSNGSLLRRRRAAGGLLIASVLIGGAVRTWVWLASGFVFEPILGGTLDLLGHAAPSEAALWTLIPVAVIDPAVALIIGVRLIWVGANMVRDDDFAPMPPPGVAWLAVITAVYLVTFAVAVMLDTWSMGPWTVTGAFLGNLAALACVVAARISASSD
jgi:hypothetical protein